MELVDWWAQFFKKLYFPLTKKDSFDRLSEAKERQSYQRLNEPGTIPLSFAFAFLEEHPLGWTFQ